MRHRIREVVPVRRRRLGFAFALAAALISGGWDDCCCERPLELADPVGYGTRVQPFKANAYYLDSFDAGPTLGARVLIKGYQASFLDTEKWGLSTRLSYQGRSAYTTSVARENDEYYHIGSNQGLLGYNTRYGSVAKYSGLPDSSPGVWSVLKRSQGGVFAGLTRASGAGQNLLYACLQAGYVCTPANGGPVSVTSGDGVWNIKAFGGAYYVLTTRGTWSSPNGISFFQEGTPAVANYDIDGEDGNLVVSGSVGAYRGAGRGQPWSMSNVGLGTGCAGVAYISPRFYIACNYPKSDVYTRLSTQTSWSSTGLNLEAGYVFGLEKYGNDLILGTTFGPQRYRSGVWSALDDCLKKSLSTLSVSVRSQILAAGGDLTGYSESTDRGLTWTQDPSTYRLTAFQVARTNLGTYFTGEATGTFYRPTGQTAFQEVGIPGATGALSLGSAGDTVLAGLRSGGVGTLSGTSYTAQNTGFDTTAAVNGFASTGGSIVALTNKGSYFSTISGSLSWTKGANRSDGQPFVGYRGISLQNGNYLLGGANPLNWNIAISNPSGTTLTAAGAGIPDGSIVYDLAEAPNLAFLRSDRSSQVAASATVLLAATSRGVYVSHDDAASWSILSKALGTAPAYSLAVDTDRIWIGTSDRGVRSYSLPIRFQRLVPIILDVDTGSAHYTTEIAVTNPGAAAADVTLQYTAAIGSGSATATDSIAPGRQIVIPDAIAYLRGKGLPIPVGGSQGGTLLMTFSNVSAKSLPVVTARTTAATGPPLPVGRAGLAYGAIDPDEGSRGTLTVYGLRSNATDRSNFAVYNTSDEDVIFSVTAYSGDGSGASSVVAAADTLPAWGWKQYTRVLEGPGYAQGWVSVTRTSTTGSFGIYGVINDNTTNDGSLVQPGSSPDAPAYTNVPVLVETGSFGSELVLANSDTAAAVFRLEYTESLAGSGGGSTNVTVPPKSHLVIPKAIDYLRTHGVSIGAAGAANYAGSLHVEVSGALPSNTYVGARTSAPSGSGGEFGLFTPAVLPGAEGEVEASINGLLSDSENRSNVAVSNTGGPNDGSITLSIQAHDGNAAGAPKGAPVTVTLAPGRWQQLNNFLGGVGVSNGWVVVTRTAGYAPWIAYGVVNDGGAPGQRTSDGAYVAMVK